MPSGLLLDPRGTFAASHIEDLFGHDRLARTLLRTVSRFRGGNVVLVQGAPGSGKRHLLQRCAYLLQHERDMLGFDAHASVNPQWGWYNPWTYQRHGNLLAGFVAAIARASLQPAQAIDRARELVTLVNRLQFDGVAEGGGTGIGSPHEADPALRIRDGIGRLVELVRGGRPGRMVLFIDDMDLLSPAMRLHLLEGFRLLIAPSTELTVVASLGREAATAAIREREGDLDADTAVRCLEEYVDLGITVPNVDIRRIGPLLRHYLAPHEPHMMRAFGSDAVMGLIAAATNDHLGTPRFLQKLAVRVGQLSEFALETRHTRELSEAQWAWVIISERWPGFRRHMIRGGRDRWVELQHSMKELHTGTTEDTRRSRRKKGLITWLRDDLLLADYLRLHADGFERDAEGIYWLETLLLAAGL